MKSLSIIGFLLIVMFIFMVLLDCTGEKHQGSSDLSVRLQEEYQVFPNITYATLSEWEGKLDLYFPKNVEEPPPVVVYFHGGGWIYRTKEDAVLSLLPYLEMGLAVVNVDYRVGPLAPAPAAVVDCWNALRWIARNACDYYLDPFRVVLTGHSAGGHLALMTGIFSANPDSAGSSPEGVQAILPVSPDSFRVAAIVNWYGPTDVTDLIRGEHARDFAQEWIGTKSGSERVARKVSPLFHVRPDMPPVLTIHGDVDPEVPFRHATWLHEALDQAGVSNRLLVVKGGGHGSFTPEEDLRLYEEIGRFLRETGVIDE